MPTAEEKEQAWNAHLSKKEQDWNITLKDPPKKKSSFWGDLWSAVSAPFTAPIKAVANIASGGNVVDSLAGAALATTGASDALLSASTGGVLSKAPVVGSYFKSASEQNKDPFSSPLIKDRLLNLGQAGIAAGGAALGGVTGGYVGYQAGSKFKSGDYAQALGALGIDTSPMGDLFNSTKSLIAGIPKGGNAPPTNNFSSPAQVISPKLEGASVGTIVLVGIVITASVFILKKKKLI